jgi:hypothetical protein
MHNYSSRHGSSRPPRSFSKLRICAWEFSSCKIGATPIRKFLVELSVNFLQEDGTVPISRNTAVRHEPENGVRNGTVKKKALLTAFNCVETPMHVSMQTFSEPGTPPRS